MFKNKLRYIAIIKIKKNAIDDNCKICIYSNVNTKDT